MAPSPTVIDAAWTFDDQNTGQNGRYVIGSLFQNSAAATAANSTWRDGVLPGVYSSSLAAYLSYRVAQNSPTGSSVLVQPGHAVVTRTGQGLYVCPNSTARVVALDAADATNPRIDLIVLQVLDQPLGDSVTQVQVRAVSGTPSGSPVAPALPTGAIPLARVAVAAAPTGNTIVDANITDLRKSAGVTGMVRPLLAGDALADTAQEGDLRYQGGLFERYTTSGGGKWETYGKTLGPWGYVASGTYIVDGGYSPPGGAETLARSFTFTAAANRRYKGTFSVGILTGSAGGLDVTWRTRWATGGSVTTSSTLITARSTRYEAAKYYSYDHSFVFTGPATAGSVTVGITFSHSNGAIDMLCAGNNGNNTNTVFIEDIGGV